MPGDVRGSARVDDGSVEVPRDIDLDVTWLFHPHVVRAQDRHRHLPALGKRLCPRILIGLNYVLLRSALDLRDKSLVQAWSAERSSPS
jgi:hypothetical protein